MDFKFESLKLIQKMNSEIGYNPEAENLLNGKEIVVVIVDDNEDALWTMMMALSDRIPFRVYGCTNGVDALECFNRFEIPLIMTDQQMPGISGIELCEEVTKISPDTIKVMVTAYSDLELAVNAINRGGVNKYVSKPWDVRQLIDAAKYCIKTWTDKKRPEDSVAAKTNEVITMKVERQKRRIFISYSKEDRKWVERIKVHLKPIERIFDVDIWEDEKIKAGQYWKECILKALKETDVAILVVTANFFASDFIMNEEIPIILDAGSSSRIKVFCLMVGPSRFSRTPELSKFHTVNDPGKPVMAMSEYEQEEIFLTLSNVVETELGLNRVKLP